MEKRVLLWEKEAVKENSKGTPEELWHREQMQTTWRSYFPGLRRVKGSLGAARPWRTFEKHIDTRLTLQRCGTAKVSSPNFQGSFLRAPVGIVFFRAVWIWRIKVPINEPQMQPEPGCCNFKPVLSEQTNGTKSTFLSFCLDLASLLQNNVASCCVTNQ